MTVGATGAADPFRPARGSLAPAAINALVATLDQRDGVNTDGPSVIDDATLTAIVDAAVARRASVMDDPEAAFTPSEVETLGAALRGVLGSYDELLAALLDTVNATPWIAKFGELSQFGLPIEKTDPLTRMCRAECLLALHLMRGGAAAAADGGIAVDFVDADKMFVLQTVKLGPL